MRKFIGKLFILSVSLLLGGFFIGYGYSVITDGTLDKNFFGGESSRIIMQQSHITPTPPVIEEINDESGIPNGRQ